MAIKKSLVHIPKNGGTTIHDIFNPAKPLAEKHSCLQEIKDNLQDSFKDWEFLCITRNPYARLYSWFKFHSGSRYENHQDMNMYKGIDFNEWINRHCPHHWSIQNHFGGKHGFKYPAYMAAPLSQKKFIEVDGKVANNLTFIKLEEISERWNEICDFFEKDKKEGKSNASSHIDEWKKAYDSNTYKIATKLLREDLEYFNYEIF